MEVKIEQQPQLYNLYLYCLNVYPKVIQTPNNLWRVKFPDINILEYFAIVLICRGGNLQFIFLEFSVSSFLVHSNCTHLLLFEHMDLLIKPSGNMCMPYFLHPREKYNQLE